MVVAVLGILFVSSLYLGFSLQSQSEMSELGSEAFIQQLNAGAFERLERSGTKVLGETATGDLFSATFEGSETLEAILLEAGAENTALIAAIENSSREPLGILLARQLLWVGPLLLLICLGFILFKGQGAIEAA